VLLLPSVAWRLCAVALQLVSWFRRSAVVLLLLVPMRGRQGAFVGRIVLQWSSALPTVSCTGKTSSLFARRRQKRVRAPSRLECVRRSKRRNERQIELRGSVRAPSWSRTRVPALAAELRVVGDTTSAGGALCAPAVA
jgi:hypothetical protein